MLERSALSSRKHRLVDHLGVLRLAENHSAARTAKRLVSRGRDRIGMRDRRRMMSSRNEARKMGHVNDELRTDLSRNFGERLELDDARVRARPGDDHLRTLATGYLLHRFVVDAAIIADAVVNRVIQQSGEIHRRAVREMATLRQVEPEHGIAGLEKRQIDR